MAQNEHKKDLRQLSEAYKNVIKEGFNELENKREDAEEFDGPGMQWDGIDDTDDSESKYEQAVRLVNELIDENSEQSENTLYHIRDLVK